ncbi:hypothetical protein CSC3H3_17305 [Thalassospira marina]|uniref:Uncharacterized protein n=1 Tax=Thalassospira marina TaxID=2048283 RepID=A0ABN5FRJ4_9PROT|nr:hypothetical protein CSC3H3_17305 [Thalassospira marina]
MAGRQRFRARFTLSEFRIPTTYNRKTAYKTQSAFSPGWNPFKFADTGIFSGYDLIRAKAHFRIKVQAAACLHHAKDMANG